MQLSTSLAVRTHHHFDRAKPSSTAGITGADYATPTTFQNKQLSSRTFSQGMSSDGSCRVADPAAHSWSLAIRELAFGQPGCIGAGRMSRQRMRAPGVDPGGRLSREPPVAGAGGTVSLSG